MGLGYQEGGGGVRRRGSAAQVARCMVRQQDLKSSTACVKAMHSKMCTISVHGITWMMVNQTQPSPHRSNDESPVGRASAWRHITNSIARQCTSHLLLSKYECTLYARTHSCHNEPSMKPLHSNTFPQAKHNLPTMTQKTIQLHTTFQLAKNNSTYFIPRVYAPCNT